MKFNNYINILLKIKGKKLLTEYSLINELKHQ